MWADEDKAEVPVLDSFALLLPFIQGYGMGRDRRFSPLPHPISERGSIIQPSELKSDPWLENWIWHAATELICHNHKKKSSCGNKYQGSCMPQLRTKTWHSQINKYFLKITYLLPFCPGCYSFNRCWLKSLLHSSVLGSVLLFPSLPAHHWRFCSKIPLSEGNHPLPCHRYSSSGKEPFFYCVASSTHPFLYL